MAPIDSESLPPQSTASSESAPLAQDEANAPRRPSTPAPKTKRSRGAASNESSVLEWTEVMVETLMRLRYDTFVARSGNAKTNAAIGAAWLLLASEMSRLHQKPICTEQCKNKVKWLKRKWVEYNSDLRATGNAETPVIEPPGLALMIEYWSSASGMHGQTLADSEGNASAPSNDTNAIEADMNDSSVAEEAAVQTTQSKKRKTMADSFELGMKSMADSFQAMSAAMSTPAPTTSNSDVAGIIDQRFAALMQRQEAQLAQMQMQTQILVQLITKFGVSNNDEQ